MLETIPEVIENLRGEQKRGFTFLHENGEERRFSFSEIYRHSCARASGLQFYGLKKGDRVALVLPSAEDFIFTFYGSILAGIIPVPIYPPPNMRRLVGYLDTTRHIIAISQSRALITVPALKKFLGVLLGGGSELKRLITCDELTDKGVQFSRKSAKLDDTAFLQFTSGSTAFPKGVTVTHRNIAANVRCFMEEGVKVMSEDVGISWLPMYHDMGLIGFVLGHTYYQSPAVFMPPLLFIKRPVEWLKLITRHSGTLSFAPNFAYGLCAARIKDSQLEDIDLRSWRVAGCGAEPIQYETLARFSKRFESVGFREDSFLPAYGMAESTLAITFSQLGTGLKVDTIEVSSLYGEGRAIPCSVKKNECLTFASCGTPFTDHELVIMDSNGTRLPEREVGEVIVKGPSVTKGYYNNEQATQETFRNGWLHTGDLGYIVDGNLYICGRKKDMIIIAGKNYYPQDIEWVVNEIDGIRRGNVVAFGQANRETLGESVIVAAESRVWKSHADELAEKIRKAVRKKLGIRINRVEVLPPGSLPKTSSGKIQRRKAQRLFETGRLGKTVSFPLWTLIKNVFISRWNYWRLHFKR